MSYKIGLNWLIWTFCYKLLNFLLVYCIKKDKYFLTKPAPVVKFAERKKKSDILHSVRPRSSDHFI